MIPTTAISFSWKVTTASSAFNIAIDNFQFAAVPGGNCPAFTATPTPNPDLIWTNSNSNQIAIPANAVSNGYWYCYSDLGNQGSLGSAANLATFNAGSPVTITVASGETTASNPISIAYSGTTYSSGTIAGGTNIVWGISTTNTGNGGVSVFTSSNGAMFQMASPGSPTSPNYCAYFTGMVGWGCTGNDLLGAYSECPFAGMGFNFVNNGTNPKVVFPLNASNPNLGFTPTGISFYAKVDPSSTTSNWLFMLPTSDTACPTCNNANFGYSFTPTTSWAQYGNTTPFTSYSQAFAAGSDGAFNINDAYACQWQNTSGDSSYGLYVDDIYFY